MQNIKKYKKICISIIFIITILLSAKAQADFTVTQSPRTDHGLFNPYKADGTFTYYCIQHSTPYEANLPAGYQEGQTYGEPWCPACGAAPTPPWTESKKTMEYKFNSSVNDREYQDAAYVMASAVEEGKTMDMQTQYSLWMTGLNIGTHGFYYVRGGGTRQDPPGTWGNEALAYKDFYNTIHTNSTDVYSSKISDKTIIGNVKSYVDQITKTYTVGPFIVEYPNGDYTATSKKWSYIENITLLDQNNNSIGNVKANSIHIVNSGGNELRDTINNNNFPNSNEEFYVKFQSTGDVSNIKLKVNFKYLESCSATMERYKGSLTSWVWETVQDSTKICPRHNIPKLSWKLKTVQGGTSQLLMGFKYHENSTEVQGRASKNYKEAELILAPTVIDLNMKIAGQVFLDIDTGKVNTGNNIMDSNNEALQGVEVTLYDAETNQVVTKTTTISQYHVHTSSCYSEVAHVHTGSAETGGGCYTTKIHNHIGNPLDGGACYQGAVSHVHTDACYTKPILHTHTGSYTTGGGCYTRPIYHTHTSACSGGVHVHNSSCYCGAQLYTPYGSHENHDCAEGHRITNGVSDWDKIPAVMGAPCNDHYNGKCTFRICGQESECTVTKVSRMIEGSLNSKYPGYWEEAYWEVHGQCGAPDTYKGQAAHPNLWSNWNGSYTHTYYDESGSSGYNCGKTEGQIEGYGTGCGYTEGQIVGNEIGCGRDTTAMYYDLTCNQPLYATSCNPNEKTKVLTCGKVGQIANTTTTTLSNPVITNSNGYYEFSGLHPMKKYYVKFVYNGMLYTNVLYNSINGDNVSKADETSRYNYRTSFNQKFAEIGSYPSNYKIVNKVFGNELGDYNKTYLQEDIAQIFKTISKNMVGTNSDNCITSGACQKTYNELKSSSGRTDEELKRMIQFAADCRISSTTVNNYPLTDKFIVGTTGKKINGVFYAPIYSGEFNQLHVNLGIKSRPTFDMALYKDVLKAEVSINGKTETYNYDSRKQSSTFSIGVSEQDYLNGLRGIYKYSVAYKNNLQTREIDRDNYNLEMRTEEIANGQNAPYNYNLTATDRLKIKVTYKIAIKNQSSTIGSVTEIVDYYDTNYKFVEAYVGDGNGVRTGTVTKYDTSKYAGTEYKSTKNAYNTIYLRPNQETKLGNAQEQYIYVVLELVGPSGDVGTLLTNKLLNDKSTLSAMNLAEINGYKTAEGLIDIDSNPGNLNIKDIQALTQENIVGYPNIREMYEDDTSRAPVIVYKTTDSKTIEGTVFEDSTGKVDIVQGAEREGNGKLDSNETKIVGVIVELIEIKNNQMIVRAQTKTNNEGWYGFTGFIAGDYVIRYTYGADNDTALTNTSVFEKGINDKSYNGQDYESTIFGIKADHNLTTNSYETDSNLIARYTENANKKNEEEAIQRITQNSPIDRYNAGYYWYTINDNMSDAKDDVYRKNQVIDYSKNEYGKEITNHKAEVFNAYINPQPEHINNAETNKKLVDELERRTYRYAYTPVLEVEIEYATKVTNKTTQNKITGVDFGIVERPKQELVIDQDVKHIKVTLSDGRVLFDTETETNNLQWINKGDINKYDKNELINVIMDEELISGAKLEVTYNLTVRNNSEKDVNTKTRAKTILNYVANNLNYDEQDNLINGKPLWKVVTKDDVQNNGKGTLVNSEIVDLSTQSIILETTEENPLAKTNLAPGEQVTTELKLKKVLATESSQDDLTYTNMAEIVEVDNTVGRYDHEATPGNQKLEEQPMEHDTAGASNNTLFDNGGQPDGDHPQDGKIIVTPPTGSKYIYYVIGITSSIILIAGIFLIKKFVIDKKK